MQANRNRYLTRKLTKNKTRRAKSAAEAGEEKMSRAERCPSVPTCNVLEGESRNQQSQWPVRSGGIRISDEVQVGAVGWVAVG